MQYIFIHGIGHDPSSWDKTISFFTKPIHAMCPDLVMLINHNDSTYSNLYRAFSDYCKNIPEPLNLCGLSLGGVLALNYAIDYPTRVQSLVLIATQYKMPKALLKLQNIAFQFMPKSTFENRGFQKEDFIQLTNSMIDVDFSKNLKDISCDTLVICGEKDSANIKAGKSLAERIPRAKLALLANAGHEVNMENPQLLAAKLESFLQRLKEKKEDK